MRRRSFASLLRGKNLTQRELADRLGISRAMVSHWCCDRKRITAERALDIERATGISRAEIRPDLFAVSSYPIASSRCA
jgi:DNA-binding transcriptional regulator YdaS (Cro superfamily)